MKTRKRILITGASSMLIQELIKKIDEDEFEIWAITRNKSKIKNPKINCFEGNICDASFVNEILKANKTDIIIHAAAVTHTNHIRQYFDVNLQSTINLVNAAKQYDVNKFVYISTRAASKQSGAYGYSKLQAEEYIKTNFKRWLIIRPSEIFGGDKNEGIDKLINDLLYKKIIVCPVNLKNKLYPIYNEDMVQMSHNLIFDSFSNNRVVTINGKEGFSYYELIRKISKTLNKKVLIIPVPKCILFTIKWIIEILKIKTGFVPDQISRLYSFKETGLSYNTISIEDYILLKKHENQPAAV